MLTVGLVFIVQTLSFMNCSCNFICGLSDVIIKTFSQSVIAESESEKIFKIGEYLAKSNCFVYFLRLLAVCWTSAQVHETSRVLATYARYDGIF